MKTIWIAVTLLLVVLAGSVIFYIYSSNLYESLQESLGRIEKTVEEEDWPQAKREAKQMEELWSRIDAAWTPTMDHRQVDHLDESLTRIIRLVDLRNREDLLLEIAVARRLAKRIKDTEVPNFQNVF